PDESRARRRTGSARAPGSRRAGRRRGPRSRARRRGPPATRRAPRAAPGGARGPRAPRWRDRACWGVHRASRGDYAGGLTYDRAMAQQGLFPNPDEPVSIDDESVIRRVLFIFWTMWGALIVSVAALLGVAYMLARVRPAKPAPIEIVYAFGAVAVAV